MQDSVKTAILVYEAAKKLDAEISAMSWNGFNLFGDKKSINELERLMYCEVRLKWFEREYQALVENIKKK